MTESPLDIAILLDDQDLIRLVATWPKLTAEQRKDTNLISDATRIIRDRVEKVITRAKTHGLIYDDGKINTYAEKFISGLVAERLSTMQKKKSK